MAFRRSLEMSIGREEFLRLFSTVVPACDIDGDTIRWVEHAGACAIVLVRMADRRLGSVTVPRHRVEIALDAASEQQGAAFLRRFRRAFLRGGG